MRKIFSILQAGITWLLIFVSVAMMLFTVVSVTTFDHVERSFFGFRFSIVLSDSMSATDFDAGDLVIARKTDPAALQPGDIISFQSTNPESYGEIVTHKIRSLTTDAKGTPGFITYGTTTDTDDTNIVTYDFVLGKYVMNVPNVGTFLAFLKTTPGYILCIFLPFLLLIVMQGIRSVRLFGKYRAEQMQELRSEQERIAAERERSRKILEQISILRQRLAESEKQNHPEKSD